MSRANEQREHGVRRLLVAAVVVPILLAAISAAWFAWQIRRIAAESAFIDQSDRVITQVGEVQKIVVDQEMGLRAFLFTKDHAFLEPFHRRGPGPDLDELDELLARDPVQTEGSRALREDYLRWRAAADRALADPTQGTTVDAMRTRKRAVDAMRAKGDEIVAREKGTRLTRTRLFERRTRRTTLGAVTILALLAGASSLSLSRRIRLVDALMKRERDALSKAQEALRAKDTFLLNLSHELRTPLTPILGWAGMARAKRLNGDALDRALELIERNAKTEAQIVDDVLDISAITAGKLRIASETVDPAAAVRAAIDVVAVSARAKGITLEVEIASPLPRVLGDPARLQQIVWNLVGNAVKFSPRSGRVRVRVDHEGDMVRIRVADDGPGITADFLPHVFDYFRQADASLTRVHGGLGLGLAIVKHLVELHGGEVEVESLGPGRGATFTVTLPAMIPEEPTPAPSHAVVARGATG